MAHPITTYDYVEVSPTAVFRGTSQQTTDRLIWVAPTSRDGGTSSPASGGVALAWAQIHNRSSATINYGIGFRIGNRAWVAGQWDDDATTPFTVDTTDAQDTGADDFALDSTTANDGYVIACRHKFNAFSMNVGTADVGGTPVRALRYSNLAGSGWSADPSNLFAAPTTSGAYSTGEERVIFIPPDNWGRTQATGLSGIPGNLYAINVRDTTAPSTSAATANTIEVWNLLFLTESLADNATTTHELRPGEAFQPDADAVGVWISSVSAVQSRVSVLVRSRG